MALFSGGHTLPKFSGRPGSLTCLSAPKLHKCLCQWENQLEQLTDAVRDRARESDWDRGSEGEGEKVCQGAHWSCVVFLQTYLNRPLVSLMRLFSQGKCFCIVRPMHNTLHFHSACWETERVSKAADVSLTVQFSLKWVSTGWDVWGHGRTHPLKECCRLGG